MSAVGCLLHAAFLAPATVIAHSFWNAPGDARGLQLANFLKNVAIIGGRLCLAATYQRELHN